MQRCKPSSGENRSVGILPDALRILPSPWRTSRGAGSGAPCVPPATTPRRAAADFLAIARATNLALRALFRGRRDARRSGARRFARTAKFSAPIFPALLFLVAPSLARTVTVKPELLDAFAALSENVPRNGWAANQYDATLTFSNPPIT